MTKELITLDNFADFHGELNGVEINSQLHLPEYVPTTEINVNVDSIATIARIGRLSAVRFDMYDEESSSSFAINGINSDGTATATIAKSSKTARSQSGLFNTHDIITYPKGMARVKINAAHPDLDDKVLREPKPWADLLNKGMCDGLKQSSKSQLLQPNQQRRVEFGLMKLWQACLAGGFYAITKEPVVAISFSAGLYVGDALGLPKIFENETQGYEHSMMRFLPYDRYALATGYIATHKLVKSKA